MIEQIKRLFKKKENQIYESMSSTSKQELRKELSQLTNHEGLNFGDYELIYLKRNLPKEQKQNIVNLLQEVNQRSNHLPTVGLELEYKTKLPQTFFDSINRAKFSVSTSVRKSKFVEGVSEIRPLFTNPYSFRWLMEEIDNHLPDISGTVQVTVGNVNDERMPYVMLALYFMYPSCIFPIKPSSHKDNVGFPGVYVGHAIDKNGDIDFRKQTNYVITYSNNIHEMVDACLYAAHLHTINEESFQKFEEELRQLLGFQKARIKNNGYTYKIENDELGLTLKKEWPMKELDTRMPYQLPQEFINCSVSSARENLGINILAENVYSLDSDAKEKIEQVNKKVKNIVERYLMITPEDIIYRNSLEKILSE